MHANSIAMKGQEEIETVLAKPVTDFMPSPYDKKAVAWRSIFVTNELNEMQTEFRKIHPETTLIWFFAFYIGLGWQWIAQTNPDFDEIDYPLEPFNDFLKFFLCSFVILVIAFTQFLYHKLKTLIDPSPSLAFADFCVLANCSVLILTEKLRGYYINGRAPWQKSDLPLSWLKNELDREARNCAKKRDFSYLSDQQKRMNGDTGDKA